MQLRTLCAVALAAGVISGVAAPTIIVDGGLRMELVTAHNAVVDSNVESPSTKAPHAAMLGGIVHNDGTVSMTDVWVYIGNYVDGVSDTPGVYPSRAHPPLVGPLPGAEFALTHEGGSVGTADASRYIGTIAPGESVAVYWLISYPDLDENGDAVWGPSVKPDDDLWLEYDIWATAQEGGAPRNTLATRTLTMRNEISAMANKILPNTAGKVPPEYMELIGKYFPSWDSSADDGSPGTRVVMEGVWYDLGNVGEGFDNDGDLIPDRNAWMQPVGDPTSFDAGCFRLIRTYAVVIVKLKGGGEQILYGENQLYFENVPDNRGAVGWVGYEFAPLSGPCRSVLSPYQEVASGFDNEKFNGDYGQGGNIPLVSLPPTVGMEKDADVAQSLPGGTVQYTVSFTNEGTQAVGKPELGVPVVLQDSVPSGTSYAVGSAAAGNTLPAGVTSYAVLYSTDKGTTWQSAEPVPAGSVTDLQWWLSDPLQPGAEGVVTFAVTVDDPYPSQSPLVVNTAGLSFGNSTPVIEDDASTLVLGDNSLGDLVFADDGSGGGVLGNGILDGSEPGIDGITVSLYYDGNSNGTVDASDILLQTIETSGGGSYTFSNLPDGNYLAVVDSADPQVPTGYTPTTTDVLPVDLDAAGTDVNPVAYLDADFGFAPVLSLDKVLTGGNPVLEGQQVAYTVDVSNRLPGNGTGNPEPSLYTTWAEALDVARSGTANKEWTAPENAYTPPGPDGNYATAPYDNAAETLAVTTFPLGTQPGSITNVELRVPILVAGTFNAQDEFSVSVVELPAGTTIFTTNYVVATDLTTGTLVLDVTGAKAWQWTDFAAGVTVVFANDKGPGPGGGRSVSVDAAGFRVTSDELLPGGAPETTLQLVPLTDTYDADLLEFVSASPVETSATVAGSAPNSVGTLQWANIGPIYPGGTKQVTVTFKALEPPGNATVDTTNTASVTGARLLSGRAANDATDEEPTTILPTGSIGDFVWRDLNGNGSQDGGDETGIAGVEVRLTPPAGVDLGNGAGNPVTNVTDRNGYYLFPQLPDSGDYTVTVITTTLPAGGGVNTYDEDGSLNDETVVTLDHDAIDGSDTHSTADFGYQVQSTIDGLVWHDLDRSADATRDTGEPWLGGVTVYLCAGTLPCDPASAIATTLTDSNGYFEFVGAYNGDYVVGVNSTSGPMAVGTWVQSFDTDGTVTADQVPISVPAGGTAHADYSYYQSGPYNIGDTIFYDWDGDAVQDAGDEGLTGVTVSLYNDADGNGVVDTADDTLMATGATDAAGNYLFAGLPSGNYLVVLDEGSAGFPALYVQTLDPDQPGVATNGDGMGVATVTAVDRLDMDFAYQPLGSGAIGDTVWFDTDGDGVQAGVQETGIPNVTVTLYADLNGDSNFVAVTTMETGSDGEYLFENLPDGSYRVDVDTADSDLPRDAFGAPYVPTTATQVPVVVAGGSSYRDSDFGFTALAALGDTVFWDANANGTQDWNEQGISNVTVNLYRDVNQNGTNDPGIDAFLESRTTDGDGRYVFSALLPDHYAVVVDHSGPIASAALTADPDSDGIPCGAPGATGCDGQYGIELGVAQTFMGADFGYRPAGALGDTLWVDVNDNGVRDDNEIGIPYVSVDILSNGVPVGTTETDADGYYLFDNLADGTYTVAVQTNDTDFPADLFATADPDGTVDNTATPVVVSGGDVTQIGTNICTNCWLDVDFGYRYAGSNVLSGTIGMDGLVPDGLLGNSPSGVNADESPFRGQTAYLYVWDDDGNGTVDPGETTLITSTPTDSNGDYRFEGLPDGDGDDRYIVSAAAPLANLALTTTTGDTPALQVVNTTNVFGETHSAYQVVAIAPLTENIDFAFRLTIDLDFGDLPISYSTQLGDAPSGARHLVGAVPVLYLGEGVDTEPNGQSTADATGDGADEDGAAITNLWRDGAGGGELTVDVGAGAGWLVGWIDFDQSGAFTGPGEMVVNQGVSNAGGVGGVYTFAVDVPTGTVSPTNTTVLNARLRLFPEEPSVAPLSFSGQADDGEVEDYQWTLGVIGDTVWLDADGDGIQDTFEPPLTGVVVFLDLDTNGIPGPGEPFDTTDAEGKYTIGGTAAGTYRAMVDTNTLPPAAVPVYDVQGPADGTALVSLTNGESRLDVDFGYQLPVLGDRVWADRNLNGIQDAGETGLVGVTVNVYDASSNLLDTAVTDAAGQYLFSDLVPGGYTLEFVAPAGYAFSPIDQGGDDVLDSDANPATGRTATATPAAGSAGLVWDAGLMPVADLALGKSVDDTTPDLGQTVTFIVTVTNQGPMRASNFTVRDLLPTGLRYVSSVPGAGSYDDVTGVWSNLSLNVGASVALRIDAGVTNTVGMQNVAQVFTSAEHDTDSTPGNDAAGEDDQDAVTMTPNPAADLELTKTVSRSIVRLASSLTYSVTVSNAGPDTATHVAVEDILPTEMAYSSHSGGVFVQTNGEWGVWQIGTLGVNNSTTLLVTVTATAVGTVTNEAQVLAADPFDPDSTPDNDDPTEDDQDDAIADVIAPAVTIDKTVSLDGTCPGAQRVQGTNGTVVTYCMIVSNTGDVPLDNVTVTDNDIDPALSTNLGTLAIGGVVTVRVDTVIDGDLTNTASVVGEDPNGDPVNDDDDAVVGEAPSRSGKYRRFCLGRPQLERHPGCGRTGPARCDRDPVRRRIEPPEHDDHGGGWQLCVHQSRAGKLLRRLRPAAWFRHDLAEPRW